MTQITTLTEHTRRISAAYAQVARIMAMMENSPHAAPAIIAARCSEIALEMATIRRHAQRAEVLAATMEASAKAASLVTVCHDRADPVQWRE